MRLVLKNAPKKVLTATAVLLIMMVLFQELLLLIFLEILSLDQMVITLLQVQKYLLGTYQLDLLRL